MSAQDPLVDESASAEEILTPELADRERAGRLGRFGRAVAQVTWPAFLGAAMAVGLTFSTIDPLEIDLVTENLADSREAAYTIGFFVFWVLFMLSGSLTWYLANTDHEAP